MTIALYSIVTFAVVTLLIFKEPTVKIPFTTKHIKIDYGIAPLLGILFLLATFSINTESILKGIVGNSTIQPYAILILFMSLAYICLSLDATGLFAYLALRATKASGNSGKKLFVYFFALSSFLTTFTSNDIVILTLTPIIYYFAKTTKIDPVPFLMGQFFAANIWSIALYTGNPTNIIVAQAYELSFIEYSKWMLLPAIISGITCLAMLYIVFRKQIPPSIVVPQVDPYSALKDKRGAIFGTICLAACITCLNLASWLNVSIWQVTLAFALVVAARDALLSKNFVQENKTVTAAGSLALIQTLRKMPWKIMPFVIGMFIMVESLSAAGYIRFFASNFSSINCNAVSASFGTTIVSSTAANLMSNQPMTILFTQMLQNPSFAVSVEAEKTSMLALILGSNFAANLTLIGSLAGLMWSKLLRDKGLKISFRQFSKYGLLIMPLTFIAACLTLLLEILLWM
ncbi:MAG: SLC13 family permease [Candidatus Bathyarchaeota archaeon]|nr:SLC13 family permease [Candidatus Bathyarchaeota archaeon]